MCHKNRLEHMVYTLFNRKMNYSTSYLKVYSGIKVTNRQIAPPSLGNITEAYKNPNRKE
jgi:hypothetical protein